MFISSSLQSFTRGPGQDVSCRQNKGFSGFCSLLGRQGSQRWAIMYGLRL